MNRSMWYRLHRALFYVLPVVALLSLTTVAATRPVPSGSSESRRAAMAWVESHRDALPTRLADVAALPHDYRSAIMKALPIERQGALWVEHWTAFVTPAGEQTPLQRRIVAGLSKPLTAEQIEFLRVEIADMADSYASAFTAEERSKKGKARCARTNIMFSSADARLLMFELGGRDDNYLWATRGGAPVLRFGPTNSAWSIAAPVRAAALRLGIVPAPMIADCVCVQGTDACCGLFKICVQSWPPCTEETCACGGVCDGGRCTYIE